MVEVMKYINIFIMAVFISSLILGSFIGVVEAADEDIIAQQYAPIFYFFALISVVSHK